MAVKGIFTSDAGITGDRKGDFASALLQIGPAGMAPILALSSGMASEGASDTVVVWFEENNLSGRINIINDVALTTTATLDDPTQVVAGAIFLVEASGEYIYVEAVAGASATITRGFAETSIVDVDGSSTPVPIQKIGTAYEEGSGRPGAIANLGYPLLNYMEIFRNEWNASRTAQQVQFHTGNVVAKNRSDAGMLHAIDQEKSLLHGRKSIGVKNNAPFHTMDGFATQIKTNITTTASPKYSDVRDFMQTMFERNIKGKPNERISFSGNNILSAIDTLATHYGTINLVPGDNEFGLEVKKWRTPFGSLNIVSHPLMVESPLWTQNLYAFHPGGMKTRWLSRTKEDTYDRDGTRAGVDADFGVFTAEMSCQLMAEKTSAKWTGLDGSADVTAL